MDHGAVLATAGASEFGAQSGLFKSIELRLWMPDVLRMNLEWSIAITLQSRDGGETLACSLGKGVPPPLAWSQPGIEGLTRQEVDFTLVRINIDGLQYPSAKAQVVVLADASSGDHVVNQKLVAP